MSQQPDSDLRAELATLRQRLGNLEAEHRELLSRASRTRRPPFSPKCMVGALPVALLLAAGRLLYAQSGDDALFIDAQGRIGIGTNQPKVRLDVQGDGAISSKLGIGTTQPSQRLQVTGGNGLVNNVFLGDVGHGQYWAGFAHSNSVSKEGYGFLQDTSGRYTLINKKSGGGYIGLRIDNADKMVLADNGNIGIGTTQPSQRLQVTGGNGLVNNVFLGDVGHGQDWAGFAHSDSASTTGYGFVHHRSGQYASINKKSGEGNIALSIDDDPKMVLADTGNIGIGTDDPGQRRLKVAGDTEVTGALFLPNGWEMSTSTNSFVFKRNGNLVLALNNPGKLQYDPGIGFYFLGYGGTCDGKWCATWDSDARLKTDIRLISSAVEKVSKLRGVTYRWNQEALDYLTRDIEHTLSAGPGATDEQNQELWKAERYKQLTGINVGVIAQDVEAVLPEAVTTNEEGYKSVRYHYLIALLIEALKEQHEANKEQAQIVARQQTEVQRLTVAHLATQQQLNELDEIKKKLAHLEADLNRFMASGASGTRHEATELSQKK